jgi:WD40 repeat protein
MIRLPSVGLGSVLSICVLAWAASSEVASELTQSQDELSRCWQDLASEDAGKAYVASWQLAKNPASALKLLRQHLSPAAEPNLEHMQTWLTELESPKFAVRDKAFKELEKQGLASPKPLAELHGHHEVVLSCAFSPDGQILATGARDGLVLLWDMSTYQCKTTLTWPSKEP